MLGGADRQGARAPRDGAPITSAPIDDAYLPLKVLSVYAGLSVRTLRSYLTHAAHPLPHYRIGGKVLVRRTEFDTWAAQFHAVSPSGVGELITEALRGL